MADAHRRKFDVVVVWFFDRMARSVSHLLRVLETFNSLGIAFVSLREQIDTSTPVGKMIFTVLGAVAELKRSLIAKRVKAGLRNARAKGKTLGETQASSLAILAMASGTLDAVQFVALVNTRLPVGWRRRSNFASKFSPNENVQCRRGDEGFRLAGLGKSARAEPEKQPKKQ